jgi:Cu(I)/Ag(I) efflux system protein CusF
MLIFTPERSISMKTIATLSMAVVLFTSGVALAQSGDMKGMDMKNMDKHCMDMQGMKGMDMQQCREMMKGMDNKEQGAAKAGTVHKATGVVKAVDPGKGTVTLAHEPVPSLKWPKMTMGFGVNDKSLFDKLAVGKKVDVEFVQKGADYIVTAVK